MNAIKYVLICNQPNKEEVEICMTSDTAVDVGEYVIYDDYLMGLWIVKYCFPADESMLNYFAEQYDYSVNDLPELYAVCEVKAVTEARA